MGIDLTLHILPHQDLREGGFSRGAFKLDRDYTLFVKLGLTEDYLEDEDNPAKKEIFTQEIPIGSSILSWNCEENLTEDSYGRIHICEAKEFKKMKLADDTSAWNRNIIEFINKLPENHIIVFLWS
ncbi:MAG: hypothetical protein PHE43_01985 [Candidatus Nanoarchaeia archaeon]|nr:hypothetical protein [Candidatus Nanoarchaeia archaeon]